MIDGLELLEIHNHIAIFTDGEYYYCDGMYNGYQTKEEALKLAKSRGKLFLVNDDQMKRLIDLGFVRDSFSYNENGMSNECWRKFYGKSEFEIRRDGTFSLFVDGDLALLSAIKKILEDSIKLRG